MTSKTLPCFTYVSTGCCPYSERCLYVHDVRIKSKSKKIKPITRIKNKSSNNCNDTFFWPPVNEHLVNYNNSEYEIYNPEFSNTKLSSIWNSFVDIMLNECDILK